MPDVNWQYLFLLLLGLGSLRMHISEIEQTPLSIKELC